MVLETNSRAVVVHAFNPSTWEAEAGGSLSLGQPGLQSQFQDKLQSYTEKPCLEKQKHKTKQNNFNVTQRIT